MEILWKEVWNTHVGRGRIWNEVWNTHVGRGWVWRYGRGVRNMVWEGDKWWG